MAQARFEAKESGAACAERREAMMRIAVSLLAAVCAVPLAVLGISTSAVAQQKTAKECSAEWRANKADNQAKGITQSAYVSQCRAGAPNAPAAAASGASAVSPGRTGSTMPPGPRGAATTTPVTGADQFATENAAKASCPSGVVIWANLNSKIYHYRGSKDYGTTKKGAYMCEKDATAQGIRVAKSEKRPS